MTRGMCIIITPPITYDYVDLGLPSGTKWATQNVGARKPSDFGLYFQWGDTQGYSADQVGIGDGLKKFANDWSDYKWYESGSKDSPNFTKYTITEAALDLEDDAAHVNMGGDWHMPTPDQIQELINTANTTSTWTTQDGVNGRLFTSKSDNSKSIFIPAAGYARNGTVVNSGVDGFVWSSMLAKKTPLSREDSGQYFSANQYSPHLRDFYRFCGYSVRGVIG